MRLRRFTLPEKLEPKASERPSWAGRDNAAPQGTGSCAVYKRGCLGVEADGLVRAEQPGSCGALYMDAAHTHAWRHTRMPGDLCHTHTHPPHMLRTHSRMPARTHTHSLFWGTRAKPPPHFVLLCKGGLGKLPHGDPGQGIRCVQD